MAESETTRADLLLTKTTLSSDERFRLLVTDVPVEKATERPPVAPSATGNHLVDKAAAGVDWKHTSSSWLNRNTKIRLFRKTGEAAWHSQEVKAKELAAGGPCDHGEGYVVRTTYYNHANPKYSAVKRVVTEVQSFERSTFGKGIYILI